MLRAPHFRLERSNSPFQDLMRRMLQVEETERLFDRRVAGVFFWEYIRLRVHYELTKRLGLLEHDTDAIPHAPSKLLRMGFELVGSAVTRNPLRAPKCSLVCFGYPRRIRQADGSWADVHLDPLLKDLAWSHLYVEVRNRRTHYHPIRTRHTVRHDVFDAISAAHRYFRPLALDRIDRQVLENLTAALTTSFGVEMDLTEIVRSTLGQRAALSICYRKLFERTRPKLVLLLSPNCRELTAVETARAMGIRTAELQHGVLSEYDPSYTFPLEGGAIRCFADDLLSFGEYWNQALVRRPPRTELHTIGFQYFEESRSRFGTATRQDRIVFISQPTIGRQLSKFAVDLVRHPEFRGRIVYRLHPDERAWRVEYPWLADSGIEIDDGSDRELYELFATSHTQVGVYSFALFEGMALGLRTCVLKLPGNEALQTLIDRGDVEAIATPEDFLGVRPRMRNFGERLFRSGAGENFRQYLREKLGPADTAKT